MTVKRSLKIAILALLVRPWLATADTAELARYLRQDGIPTKESRPFLEQVSAAGTCYRTNLGKLAADAPLPKPLEQMLSKSGELIRAHHLGGDQAVELLGALLTEVNPKASAAAPVLSDLKTMMSQHHVPGDQLFEFLEPSIKQSITSRLRGQRPPQPGLTQLQRATLFANRYGIPTQQLVGKLQQLRSTMQTADES